MTEGTGKEEKEEGRAGSPVDLSYRPYEPGTLLVALFAAGRLEVYSNPTQRTRVYAPHLSHHQQPMAIVGPGERFLVIGSTSDGLRWWLAVVLAQTGTVGWVADRPIQAGTSTFPSYWGVLA